MPAESLPPALPAAPPCRNQYDRMLNRLRSQLSRLRHEQALVEAYAADGWRGASREKVKPVAEIKRAKDQVGAGGWVLAWTAAALQMGCCFPGAGCWFCKGLLADPQPCSSPLLLTPAPACPSQIAKCKEAIRECVRYCDEAGAGFLAGALVPILLTWVWQQQQQQHSSAPCLLCPMPVHLSTFP